MQRNKGMASLNLTNVQHWRALTAKDSLPPKNKCNFYQTPIPSLGLHYRCICCNQDFYYTFRVAYFQPHENQQEIQVLFVVTREGKKTIFFPAVTLSEIVENHINSNRHRIDEISYNIAGCKVTAFVTKKRKERLEIMTALFHSYLKYPMIGEGRPQPLKIDAGMIKNKHFMSILKIEGAVSGETAITLVNGHVFPLNLSLATSLLFKLYNKTWDLFMYLDLEEDKENNAANKGDQKEILMRMESKNYYEPDHFLEILTNQIQFELKMHLVSNHYETLLDFLDSSATTTDMDEELEESNTLKALDL